MVEVKLNASVRAGKTSRYKHNLRQTGKIPAVIYGNGISSEAIELDARDLESTLQKKGRNALIDLMVKGQRGDNKYVVMVKEVQRDPIRREIIHADLCKISLQDKVHTAVPIHLTGEAQGVKKGGIIQLGLRELEVESMPANIPESIAIDVSELDVGDHLTVANLPTSPDYRILNDQDSVIVTIVAPRMAEEPATDADDTAVSPDRAAEGK